MRTCLLLLALTAACDCEPHHQVTFGLDAREAPAENPAPAPVAVEDTVEGTVLPEGTTETNVAGASLRAETGTLRAVLEHDREAQTQAYVVRVAETTITIEVAEKTDGDFDRPRAIATLTMPAVDCALDAPSLRILGGRYFAAQLLYRCGEVPHLVAAFGRIQARPRPLETFSVLPENEPSIAREPGDIAIEMRTAAHDEQLDLVLELAFTRAPDATPLVVSLPYEDRVSGLARNPAEPERSLAAAAQAAEEQRAATPAVAASTADRILAAHRALCRQSGVARVALSGATPGLDCRPSTAAGGAAIVRAMVLATGSDPFAAIDAFDGLSDPTVRVSTRDRRTVEESMNERFVSYERPSRPLEGATFSPAVADVRLSQLGFESDDVLLVRGEPGARVMLAEGAPAAEPPPPSDGLVRDTSGRFVVADVVRTCEGYALSIVRSDQIVSGQPIGQPVGEVVLEALPPPLLAACPQVPDSVRRDRGGLVVLGWAPQGVVAARGPSVFVAPLTADARPAGAPTVLPTGTPLPSPLAPGSAAADGSGFAFVTHFGIGIVRRGEEAPRFVRPQGFRSSAGPITDVALSPSGSRLAYAQGGVIVLVEPVSAR